MEGETPLDVQAVPLKFIGENRVHGMVHPRLGKTSYQNHYGGKKLFIHNDGYHSYHESAERAAEEENIIELARIHGYKRVPDMGSSGGDGRGNAFGFTPSEKKEWAEIHSHCGSMGAMERAEIIYNKQKIYGCSAENFHECTEYVADLFLDYVYNKYTR